MMNWLQVAIKRWRGDGRLAELAEKVAHRSVAGVWQRVHQRVGSMGDSEARGYVRARAAAVVHQEVGRILAGQGRPVSEPVSRQLRMLATEAVIRLIAVGRPPAAAAWYPSRRAA